MKCDGCGRPLTDGQTCQVCALLFENWVAQRAADAGVESWHEPLLRQWARAQTSAGRNLFAEWKAERG